MLRSAQLTPLCAAPEQSCPPASAVCPSNRSMEDTTGYKINSFKPHQSPRCTGELYHPCSAIPALPTVTPCRASTVPSFPARDAACRPFPPEAQMWRFLSCFLKLRVSWSRKER